MANAKHLATACGYNAQTSPFGPFAAIENIMPLTRGPPTFWLNNQHIQGSLEIYVIFSHRNTLKSDHSDFFQNHYEILITQAFKESSLMIDQAETSPTKVSPSTTHLHYPFQLTS